MKKLLLISFVVVLLTGCHMTNSSTITLEQYNSISTGISYGEFNNIVGSKCLKSAELGLGDINQEIYTCSGKDEKSSAIFTFQNNKLVTKVQSGLE